MSPDGVRYNPYLPEFAGDPYPQLRALQQHDPVHRSFMGSWVVTRYHDVAPALKDPRLSSALHNWSGFAQRYEGRPAIEWLLSHSVLNTDPPQHADLRKVITKAFGASLRIDLSRHLHEFFVSQVAALQGLNEPVDAIASFALAVPLQTIAHLFGLQADEHDMVKAWSNDVAGLMEPLPTGQALDDAEASIWAFREWIEARLRCQQDERSLPGRIGRLLRQGEIDPDYAVANLILLYPAGHETTVNLLGSGLLCLLRCPEQMARLRAAPDLLPAALEEVLRFEPPQQIAWRNALEDVEIGGTPIGKGEQLMLALGAANRDPAVFPEPDRFDIGRTPNPHLSFGRGRHACLGAWLGRLQGELGLAALLAAVDDIALAGVPEWLPTRSFHGLKHLPVRIKPPVQLGTTK